MSKHFDILIIGYGPSGVTSATIARRFYSNKSIAIINKGITPVIPCAIPYMFYTFKPEQNILSYELVKKNDISIIIDEIKRVDPIQKAVFGDNVYTYEKLIIATGGKPIIPPIPGVEKKHIYSIIKAYEHQFWLKKDLERASKVVIIGASFSGLEFANELSNLNLDITIVDRYSDPLEFAFDKEIREDIRKQLESKGVKFIMNEEIVSFEGDEFVRAVKLKDKVLPVDLVILATGYKPNSDIVKDTPIELNKDGFIKVNLFQEATVKDVFAVGDVAEKRSFFTNIVSKLMLAGIACKEARIAALNLYKKIIQKEEVIPVYSTYIKDTVYANAGLTEDLCIYYDIDYIIGRIDTFDKHPVAMPNAKKIIGKLIFTKEGVLIGAQMYGSQNVSEIINLVVFMIQKKIHIQDIINEKIATQPFLTSSPITYPLIQGALDALYKLRRMK